MSSLPLSRSEQKKTQVYSIPHLPMGAATERSHTLHQLWWHMLTVPVVFVKEPSDLSL